MKSSEVKSSPVASNQGVRLSAEVVLDQGSPRRGNSSKGGGSVLQSLERGTGREALEGETPRREGTRIHRPSKGERELGPSKGWSVVFGLRRFCLNASKAGGSVAAICARNGARAYRGARVAGQQERDATYRMIDD